MNSEQFYRLALRHIEGFGPITTRRILRAAGSASDIFLKPDSWRKEMNAGVSGVPDITVTDAIRRDVDAELRHMEKHNIRLAFYTDADYPYRLKSCPDAPVSFYYKGNAGFNADRMLAVVGTRNSSGYGCDCVRKLLSDLRDSDIRTVSGLAYGIDTAAHKQSIENHLITFAVMGSGFHAVYPSINRGLSEQIIETGGALITEYDFDEAPDRGHFPQRNRIIAGMADAVVVAESGLSGGSIITARIAHSYNRDVFAIPGSVFSKTYMGCHELINKNMAVLLASGRALLDNMNWGRDMQHVQTALFEDLTETEKIVVDLIRERREIRLDTLMESLPQFSPSRLAGLLLGLELKDTVVCRPGKVYTLRFNTI